MFILKNLVNPVQLTRSELRLDRFVTMLRFGASDRRGRHERLRSYVLRDVLPRLSQRREAAISDRLHDHVSNHCRLNRPSENGQPGRVGCRLIQVTILTAAANNLHAADLSSRQRLDLSQHGGVAKRQRVEDHFRDRCRILRHLLARFCKLRCNCLEHTRRIEEPRVVRKNQRRIMFNRRYRAQ